MNQLSHPEVGSLVRFYWPVAISNKGCCADLLIIVADRKQHRLGFGEECLRERSLSYSVTYWR